MLKLLSTSMNICPQPWLPMINGPIDDALRHVVSGRRQRARSIDVTFQCY